MHRFSPLPFVAGGVAIGIFIFDTVSPLPFAVAVLYVVVVSIAATYYQRQGVLIAAGACAALTVLSYLLVHGFKIDGSAPLRSSMSLAAVGITTFLALKNLSAKERLRKTERERANLVRFFSPQQVNQLIAIDNPLSVARHHRAAVLFVDMIGSTAYFSRITPDAVIVLLRELLALLSEAVFAHNGTIDKFLGDGLMAVFGPPIPSPADATNAARCALEIQRLIVDWNQRCQRSDAAAIQVAVGLHYGDVVQADIGSDKRVELTVLGDTVNIASRVEAYCRTLDAAVLATAAFVDALCSEDSDDLAEKFTDQGCHLLRGRADPIRLYGVRRSAASPFRQTLHAVTIGEICSIMKRDGGCLSQSASLITSLSKASRPRLRSASTLEKEKLL